MNHLLNPVSPPALPLAREQYDRPYQDQLNNVLRLYFEKLNFNLNNVTNASGGRHLQFPYAAVQRTTDKLFTANTATLITFDQNDYLNACTNDGTDGIVVEYTGLYNYQFSVQFANTAAQEYTAWIWLRKNTTDVPNTGSKFDVPKKHGGGDGYLIAACNFYIDLAAGDSISLYAAVSQAYVPATTDGIYMEAYPAQTVPPATFAHPAIPSVVSTLTFVSSYEV